MEVERLRFENRELKWALFILNVVESLLPSRKSEGNIDQRKKGVIKIVTNLFHTSQTLDL